jgi:hypothetical protein
VLLSVATSLGVLLLAEAKSTSEKELQWNESQLTTALDFELSP